MTIREQALAAPVAVLLVLALDARRRGTFRWRVLIANGAAFGLAVLAFELWRRSLPDGDPPQIESPQQLLQTLFHTSVQAYFTLALALVPVVFLVARPWTWRLRTWLVALAVAVVAALTVASYGQLGFFLAKYSIAPGGPYWGPATVPRLPAARLAAGGHAGLRVGRADVRRAGAPDPHPGPAARRLRAAGCRRDAGRRGDRPVGLRPLLPMVMAPLLAVLLAERAPQHRAGCTPCSARSPAC